MIYTVAVRSIAAAVLARVRAPSAPAISAVWSIATIIAAHVRFVALMTVIR